MDKSFESAEEVYSEGKSKVKEGYGKAQQKIDDLLKETQSKANRSWEDFKDYSRNHPAQALGIAIGAGAVIGMILGRAMSPSQSGVEQRIRSVVRDGQETWDEVKGGLEQALNGIRGAFEAFRR